MVELHVSFDLSSSSEELPTPYGGFGDIEEERWCRILQKWWRKADQ